MEPGRAHGWWIVADMPFHDNDCERCKELGKYVHDGRARTREGDGDASP